MIGNDEYGDLNDGQKPESEQPLSSMDFSTDHELGVSTGSGSGRRLDRNAVVLAVIVFTAIVGLWSMRTLTRTSAESSVTGMVPDHVNLDPIDKRIIHRLVVQSPSISEIGGDRDPFSIWEPAGVTDEAALMNEFTGDGVTNRDRLCEVWREEVERIAGLLKLKSVLGGGTIRALVNIEGVLLAMGETFDIADTKIDFSVEGTGRRSVRLGSYNTELDCWHEVEVSMDGDR
jgi:hypothetical protein